jgi:hypothetical protein
MSSTLTFLPNIRSSFSFVVEPLQEEITTLKEEKTQL